MRYISEVRSIKDGKIVAAAGSVLKLYQGADDLYLVGLREIGSKKDTYVQPSSLLWRNALGYGENISGGERLLVCFNDKTASVHKYMMSAETVKGSVDLGKKRADFIVLNRRDVKDKRVNVGNHVLNIDTVSSFFKVSGKLGSVAVSREDSFGEQVMPLYNLLGILCQETGIDVMSYDTIQLYSSRLQYKTQIELVHNTRANTFFTKMYIDLVGERK